MQELQSESEEPENLVVKHITVNRMALIS